MMALIKRTDIVLKALRERGDTADLSQARIAIQTGLGTATVQRYIKQLEKSGKLLLERDSLGKPYSYTIVESEADE